MGASKPVVVEEEADEISRGERLHQLRKELLKLVVSATEHYFRLGELMKEIRDNELWRESYESFAAFYSDPELDFHRSSVYRAIKYVEILPEWQKFIDIPVGKLDVIAPHINEKNRNELVNLARALSRSDLYHQLRVKRIAEVEPRFQPLPKIYPCSTCGKARGISWDGLCHCGWTPGQIEIISKAIERINDNNEEKLRIKKLTS